MAGLEARYGLNQPVLVQYFKWMGNLITLDLGKSLATQQRVIDILGERVPLTAMITLLTTVFTFAVAIPIGIYAATHQYSLTDYSVSTLGFIGLATPNFLLALILMFLASRWLGVSIGGLYSPEMVTAPFSVAKLWDLIKHLPVPIIVVGTAGTAGLIRIMRATMLDELRKQYVITARSKGVQEQRLLFKYPVRIAVNPLVSTIGWLLPEIISGETITAIVLSLPTVGAAAAHRAAAAGHVPGRQHHRGAQPAHRDRHAGLRHAAGGGRSAHPDGAQGGGVSTGLGLPVQETEATDQLQEQYFVASQWQLVWRKFRRHHLAVLGMSILAVLYFLAAFAEFFAPYDKLQRNTDLRFAPPQRIRIFENGRLTAPYVYGYTTERNLETFREEFTVDASQRFRIGLFVRAGEYRLWGLFKSDLHFYGTRDEGGYVYLLGTERLGRDVLSRIVIASRISLSVGLVGVFIAFILGCLLGGLSGYIGGWVDNVIQRLVEILISVPTIPLWLALSAALPPTWSIVAIYFGITVILSLIGWTGLARVVRGKLLEVREADFVLAARIAGKRELPIIREHLLPSFHQLPGGGRLVAHPGDDPWRDRAELPRLRHPTAGGEPRGAADRRPERGHPHHPPVDAAAPRCW